MIVFKCFAIVGKGFVILVSLWVELKAEIVHGVVLFVLGVDPVTHRSYWVNLTPDNQQLSLQIYSD